jgi:hypothetical protein
MLDVTGMLGTTGITLTTEQNKLAARAIYARLCKMLRPLYKRIDALFDKAYGVCYHELIDRSNSPEVTGMTAAQAGAVVPTVDNCQDDDVYDVQLVDRAGMIALNALGYLRFTDLNGCTFAKWTSSAAAKLDKQDTSMSCSDINANIEAPAKGESEPECKEDGKESYRSFAVLTCKAIKAMKNEADGTPKKTFYKDAVAKNMKEPVSDIIVINRPSQDATTHESREELEALEVG